MKMSITAFGALPSTSRARLLDVVADLEKVFKDHKCEGVNFTLGIVPAETTTRGKGNDEHEQAGAVRTERGQAAADDFGADDEPAADGEDSGKPAGRKPRSDAGKPRGKRGAAEGSAAEGPERGPGRPEGKAESGGHGGGGAPEGGRRRSGEGADAGGRSGRGGAGPDAVHGGNGKAAEVAAEDEDWGAGSTEEDAADLTNQEASTDPEFDTFEEGEAWWAKTPDSDGWPASLMPEGALNKGALSRIMSDHFRANGGKSRQATFDLLAEVTGAEDLDKVHADDFDKLARAMLRDTAKLRHGVKKPGGK